MDLKWIVPTFALILLLCGNVDCRRQKQVSQYEMVSDIPSCAYDYIINEIDCYDLKSISMILLKQALQETSQIATSFGVYLFNCDGPNIPVDVFSGYNLSTLILDGSGFTGIPYQLLSNIQSPLQQLYLYRDTYLSPETTATELFLPFSDHLIYFEMQYIEIHKIALSTFMQYSGLTQIQMLETNLESIGLELLQLYKLEVLALEDNNISAIETGAFRDLKNIKNIWLDRNSLSELQEGAFMGLETSPIYDMSLYDNPFKCDCNLQWLKDWLNARHLTESSGARCAYPTDAAFNDIEFCPTTART